MKLGNISNIYTGLVMARKKARSALEGDIKYKALALKSFEDGGWLNERGLDEFISYDNLDDKYLTKKDDVIIRLSAPYTSVCIVDSQEGFAIPSNFAVIRINNPSFNPEFVSVFLNMELVLKKLSQSAFGTTIPLIKTSSLKDLDINGLPLDTQKKIVELNKLQIKEKKLLAALMSEKDKLMKSSLNKILSMEGS